MTSVTNKNTSRQLYPDLRKFLDARAAEFDLIPAERMAELARVADYVRSRPAKNVKRKIAFVSHQFAQATAQDCNFFHAVHIVNSKLQLVR